MREEKIELPPDRFQRDLLDRFGARRRAIRHRCGSFNCEVKKGKAAELDCVLATCKIGGDAQSQVSLSVWSDCEFRFVASASTKREGWAWKVCLEGKFNLGVDADAVVQAFEDTIGLAGFPRSRSMEVEARTNRMREVWRNIAEFYPPNG